MSEYRKAAYGIQVQHGPDAAKATRFELYRAGLWWFRPSFRDLYPEEVWDDLFRVRVDGRWWWLRDGEGQRYPFYTHVEAWRVISLFTARLVALPIKIDPVPIPTIRKGDLVVTHVDGFRTKTFIRTEPWLDHYVYWTQVVGIPHPLPVNSVFKINEVR